MKKLFEYNWQIRDEWLDWCTKISNEELFKERTGGLKSIGHTIFHVIRAEIYWINDLLGKDTKEIVFDGITSVYDLINLSNTHRKDIEVFVNQWNDALEDKILKIEGENGYDIHCTYGDAIRHVIVHEVHHMGQLSIWARELKLEPVSANLIHKGLFIDNKK